MKQTSTYTNLYKYPNLHKSIARLKELHLALVRADERSADLALATALWYDSVDRLYATKGPMYATGYLKECRQRYLCYLSGHKYDPNVKIRVRVTSSGLPKILGKSLIGLVRRAREGIVDERRVLPHVLTMLFASRNLPVPSVPADFSTITDGSLPTITEDLRQFCKREISVRKWKIIRKSFATSLSTSMGPQGPAMLTSYDDLNVLSSEDKETLRKLTHPSAQRDLYIRDDYAKWPSLWRNPNKSATTRRLVPIPDKEGKTRIIAIFDYWSQCSLKPLHDSLNDILRTIKEDCTFNQSAFLAACDLPEGVVYHSVDLKAATDYFPVNFQEMVLSMMSDEEFASAWRRVMVGKEFHTEIGPVRYAQGQPMGAYSSWPIMAICHHLLIRWAASRKGIRRPKYFVLGDDALLVGDDLYQSYREVCDLLHMKVNLSKTFRSTRMFEFAKRFFFERKEISAFPLGALMTSECDISRIAVALDNAKAKSWFGGSEWYRANNVAILRRSVTGFIKVLSQGKSRVDLSLVHRTVRLMKLFVIVRMAYRGGVNRYELLALLPVSPSCNARIGSIVARLRYLFELSVSEKAQKALGACHFQLFAKKGQMTMKLMMTGLPPPPYVPNTLPGFPHPVFDYLMKVIADLGSIGAQIGSAALEGRTFEEVNSWLDAMEKLPASWEAINNEKGAVKRARILNDVGAKMWTNLHSGLI